MKLDNSKLSAINTAGSTAYTNLETQLYNVEKTLTVLTKSLNFKGTGAEQYKSFMQENSVNATYVLLQVGKDVKEYIEKIKKGFLEFESDESGKVSSSRVDDVKKSLENISKAVTSDIDDLTSNEEKAAEYISISPTHTSKLTDGFTTLDTNLETVNKDFKTKDDELSKGAESILTSISKLDTMITNVLNNYVTSSGKYNDAKFKELKQEEWYIKGNGSILDNKRKQDPYSYNTAYYSVFQGQFASGVNKDVYSYGDLSLGSMQVEGKTEDGISSIKGSGDVISGKINAHIGPVLDTTATARVGHLDFDAAAGWKNGAYLKGNAELYSAQARVSTLDNHLYVEVGAKTYAKAEVSAYTSSKKSEIGFDIGASKGEVSLETGLDLGHYQVKNEAGNKVEKSLLKFNVEGEATAGGGVTLKASDEQAYDSFLGNKDWDVRVINLKAGGKLGLGINFDISIPYIWPDGWFR